MKKFIIYITLILVSFCFSIKNAKAEVLTYSSLENCNNWCTQACKNEYFDANSKALKLVPKSSCNVGVSINGENVNTTYFTSVKTEGGIEYGHCTVDYQPTAKTHCPATEMNSLSISAPSSLTSNQKTYISLSGKAKDGSSTNVVRSECESSDTSKIYAEIGSKTSTNQFYIIAKVLTGSAEITCLSAGKLGVIRTKKTVYIYTTSDAETGCGECSPEECVVDKIGMKREDITTPSSCVTTKQVGSGVLGSEVSYYKWLPGAKDKSTGQMISGCFSSFNVTCESPDKGFIKPDDNSGINNDYENNSENDPYSEYFDLEDGGKLTCAELLGASGVNILNLVFIAMRIAAPIILIVISMLDFSKAVASSNADEYKVASMKLAKRASIVAIIILLPVFIVTIGKIAGYDLSCISGSLEYVNSTTPQPNTSEVDNNSEVNNTEQ